MNKTISILAIILIAGCHNKEDTIQAENKATIGAPAKVVANGNKPVENNVNPNTSKGNTVAVEEEENRKVHIIINGSKNAITVGNNTTATVK